MARDELAALSAFLAVAEELSFTRAAKRLKVTPSAVSHTIRSLEESIGVRLLSRSTRSVSPTEAGNQILSRLGPALRDIQEVLGQVAGLRDKPAGIVRLLIPRLAATTVISAKLGQFAREYPEVVLDVTSDDSRMDIVAGGFDAGIHFGEYIAKDMVAVRVSNDQRAAIVGSPDYLQSHPIPKTPRDLLQHRCINFRHGSAGIYRWEFEKDRKPISVSVTGPLIVDDVELVIRAAEEGVGLAFVSDDRIEDQLAKGALIRVLDDWCQPFPGFFLYYPNRRHQSAALSALIKVLRFRA